MDKMKSQILEDNLGSSANRWKMAEEFFHYAKRKDLLSDMQLQMIQEFLNEDEKNKSLSKDISDNFKVLLEMQIKAMSIDIIDDVMSKFNQIKSAEFGGLATHNHYINFDLSNSVRMQFRYSNYPYFNFQSIWVQFFKTDFKDENLKSVIEKIDLENVNSFKWNSIHVNQNYKFIDDNSFYNVIFNKEERQRVVENHSKIYSLVHRLIEIYNIDLENVVKNEATD